MDTVGQSLIEMLVFAVVIWMTLVLVTLNAIRKWVKQIATK